MDGIVVEVLDDQGAVAQRIRLRQFPATLGRAPSNDVILDDPEASAVHARITRSPEGALVLEDAQSRNGLFRVEPRERVSRLELAPDCRVVLGQTTLVFRDPDGAVEPTVISRGPPARSTVVGPRARLGLALVGLGLMATLDAWLTTWAYVEKAKLLETPLVMLTAVGVWAAAWSFVSRLTRGRFNLTDHFTAAALAFVLIEGIDTLRSYVAFSLATRLPFPVTLAPNLAVLVWLLHRHLQACSRWAPRRLWVPSGAAIAALGALALASHYADQPRFTTSPSFSADFKPPGFRMTRLRTIEEVLSRTQSVRRQVDALALEDAPTSP